MSFDLSRLRRGERVAGVGAVVLFLLMFFHWYSVSVDATIAGVHQSHDLGGISAWGAFGFIDLWLLLAVVVAGALVFLTGTQRTPALPVTTSVITTAVAGIGVLLVLFRIVDTPGPGGSQSILGVTATIDVSPTIWAFLGLIAIAAVAYGGFLSMREEGTTLGDVGAQARSAVAGTPPPPPPPPPSSSEPPVGAAPPQSAPPPPGGAA